MSYPPPRGLTQDERDLDALEARLPPEDFAASTEAAAMTKLEAFVDEVRRDLMP
jgi:hypothetical protein